MTSEHIILSVPYSGARSLAAKLGDLISNGKQWHFGGPGHMESIKAGNYIAHIPVRHPLDVANSWASRPIDKTPDDMVDQYDAMFEYIRHHESKLHRMESLPKVAGMDEHDVQVAADRVTAFTEAVRMHVIEPYRVFFNYYYEDLDRGA